MVWLAACTTVQPAPQAAHRETIGAGTPITIYLARRKWHVDVGFAAADLDPSLMPLQAQFRTAKYLFFGFGDRHYLLTKNKTAPAMSSALWPGPALVLVTAIENSPALAFGESQVLTIQLQPAQARALQTFIRDSIPNSTLFPTAPGPYEGSAYYSAAQQYSALHTCNTWAAEALQAAGWPIHAQGVIFAGQLWRQAARPAKSAASAVGMVAN